MPRGGKVTKYPDEFKQTAIELALAAGEKPVSEVARELKLSVKTLHNWLSQYRQKHTDVTSARTNDGVEAELKRLRKENAQLKMERDILKKATAFFAKEAH